MLVLQIVFRSMLMSVKRFGIPALQCSQKETKEKFLWKSRGLPKSYCAVVTIELFYLKFKIINSFICRMRRKIILLFSVTFIMKVIRAYLKEYIHHLNITINIFSTLALSHFYPLHFKVNCRNQYTSPKYISMHTIRVWYWLTVLFLFI